MPGDKLGEKTGKRQPVWAAVGISGVPVLEPEGRTESYFKVIMRSVIEVDFVARLKTQSDRAPEAFDTGARVHGKTSVPGLNATQSSHEPRGRVLIGNAEIHETELAGDIGPKRPELVWNLGPNNAVKGCRFVFTNCVLTRFENALVKFRLKSYDISASS